jgi:hypothetical protein
MPVNASDLQFYPCAGSPPTDAFMADTLVAAPPVVTFIDALAGSNTNRGLSGATALADPFELEQRWGAGRTTGQGPVGNSPTVPRRAVGAMGINLVNVVNGWIFRVPFELARANQPVPGVSLQYQLPLNGAGVALNTVLTFWDEGGTCSSVSQILLGGNGVNVGGVPIFALNNPSQQVSIQFDGANWQVIANTNPGGAPGKAGQRVTFVFRPGGPASENVYIDWATMMADVATVAGPKWIEIDASLAVANVAVGTWNVDDCTFTATVIGAAGFLNFPDGAHFTWKMLILRGNVRFVLGGLTPVAAAVAGMVTYMHDSAIIQGTAGHASFFDVGVAGFFPFSLFNSAALLGNATGAVLTAQAGFTVSPFVLDDCVITANALQGLGRANVAEDAAGTVLLPQPITTLFVFTIAVAKQIGFTPAVAGNWTPAPTLVSAALDALAAPNFISEINAAAIPAAAVVSYDSVATITKTRSGKVRIVATMTVLNSVPTKNTFNLRRDGGVLAGSPRTKADTLAGTINTPATIAWIDTLPDALPHTYGIQCDTAAAGVANVFASGDVGITVDELG